MQFVELPDECMGVLRLERHPDPDALTVPLRARKKRHCSGEVVFTDPEPEIQKNGRQLLGRVLIAWRRPADGVDLGPQRRAEVEEFELLRFATEHRVQALYGRRLAAVVGANEDGNLIVKLNDDVAQSAIVLQPICL